MDFHSDHSIREVIHRIATYSDYLTSVNFPFSILLFTNHIQSNLLIEVIAVLIV